MPIHLDNNATTATAPEVINAVHQELLSGPANPSSSHTSGRKALARLTTHRQTIADILHVQPKEIVFTSGGTEGMNSCLRGILASIPEGHIISSACEHSCVYQTLNTLKTPAREITFLCPGKWGAATPEEVKEAIQKNTKLICLMAVNNETGVKTDIAAIAEIAQENRIPFVVDGVALFGKEHCEISPGVDAMCFSGHKFHAPKGVGFSYIRRGLPLVSIVTGGNQEFGRRAGTESLPLIAGLAKAVELAQESLPESTIRMRKLRDLLEAELLRFDPSIEINGQGARICNTSNLYFPQLEGETLLASLDLRGIAVSHGSACSSGALEPSRVLLQMGLPIGRARSSIRFSLSRETTEKEIRETLNHLKEILTAT